MDDRDALQARIAELEERNRRLEILHETARDLGSTLKLEEVLDRLLARTLRVLRSDIGSILVLDAEEDVLALKIARGLDQAFVETGESAVRVKPGEGISGWVAEHRQPLLVRDVEADPRFARRSLERYTTASLISAPLLARERLIGVMNVNNKQSGEAFTSDDLDLLVAIASHAAIAIDNASLYEETLARTHLDSLTGLYHHGYFQKVLAGEVERAERYGRALSIVLIDVDDFKRYNDTFGHARGDEALRDIADLVRVQSRSSDVVARTGGDEFGAILPETDYKSATLFAEKVRESIAAHPFPGRAGDLSEQLTVSMGVASCPDDAHTRTELFDVADSALYQSKFSGKNRVSGAEDI